MATLMSLQNLKETRSFSLICAHCESCIEFGLKISVLLVPRDYHIDLGRQHHFLISFLSSSHFWLIVAL